MGQPRGDCPYPIFNRGNKWGNHGGIAPTDNDGGNHGGIAPTDNDGGNHGGIAPTHVMIWNDRVGVAPPCRPSW